MRSRTAKWFECRVAFEKMLENGQQKKVTEQYVLDAISFTEAEAKILDFISQYVSGEFEIRDIKPAQYGEVFFMDMPYGDTRWYKAKLQFITIDEKTEKEKRSNVTYLVEACSLHNALDNVDVVMEGTLVDYVQANVGETQIVDVFESSSNDKSN